MVKLRPFLLVAGQTIFLIGISISVAVTSVVAQAGSSPGATGTVDGNATVRANLAFDVVSIRPTNAGPDQFRLQVLADHHHATLCIAAYGFLVAERSRFFPSARAGRLHLSAPETPPHFRPRGSPGTRRAA